jgi:hypothetical protein
MDDMLDYNRPEDMDDDEYEQWLMQAEREYEDWMASEPIPF